MKSLPIDFKIDGIDGSLELREPSVGVIKPHLHLMQEDTQAFMLEVLNVSLYADGKPVDNVLDKIGLSSLVELTPLVTELLGFGEEEKKD